MIWKLKDIRIHVCAKYLLKCTCIYDVAHCHIGFYLINFSHFDYIIWLHTILWKRLGQRMKGMAALYVSNESNFCFYKLCGILQRWLKISYIALSGGVESVLNFRQTPPFYKGKNTLPKIIKRTQSFLNIGN